jgi:hypothetical protein
VVVFLVVSFDFINRFPSIESRNTSWVVQESIFVHFSLPSVQIQIQFEYIIRLDLKPQRVIVPTVKLEVHGRFLTRFITLLRFTLSQTSGYQDLMNWENSRSVQFSPVFRSYQPNLPMRLHPKFAKCFIKPPPRFSPGIHRGIAWWYPRDRNYLVLYLGNNTNEILLWTLLLREILWSFWIARLGIVYIKVKLFLS